MLRRNGRQAHGKSGRGRLVRFAFRGRRWVLPEEGSALVEFALSLPLILALLFGVIEVSYAIYSSSFINEAAREACRYAIVNGASCTGMPDCGFTDSNTTLQRYVQSLGYPGIDGSTITVTSTWYTPSPTGVPNPSWVACATGTGCNAAGDMVKVVVQYPFQLNIPYWTPVTVTLKTSSQMVISQ